MEQLPSITEADMRLVALEEGLRASISLDALRLQMLNSAVDWLVETTDLSVLEVRRYLADRRGGQVARNLATIKAVRSLLSDEHRTKQ